MNAGAGPYVPHGSGPRIRRGHGYGAPAAYGRVDKGEAVGNDRGGER